MIELRDVRKTYGGVIALDGVDLRVEPGAVHCLVGPNGSGKTTLLRVILGLTRPSSGTVSLPDASIGAAFQAGSLYDGLTVADNLDAFGAMAGGVDPAWRETVVERLGLGDLADRVAGDLSAGNRKRVDLALGLLGRPAYLVLDEPLADLDGTTRSRVVELVGGYGPAVLVSTHDLAAFAPHCDRLTVLVDGRVVLDAARSELDDPVAGYRDALPG